MKTEPRKLFIWTVSLLIKSSGKCRPSKSWSVREREQEMAVQCLLLVAVSLLTVQGGEDGTKCPSLRYGSNCKSCFRDTKLSICTENASYLHVDYRLFLSNDTQVLGHSIFERSAKNISAVDLIFQELVHDVDELNKQMCSGIHRETSKFCSRCEKGYAPSPYTYYGIPCTKCSKDSPGWLFYILLELSFPTLVFLVSLLLRIRITSGCMIGFIFYCQVVANTLSDPYYHFVLSTKNRRFTNTILSLYGLWNMDFFRFLIPKFCVSPHLRTLDVVALGYVSAFYPLLLTAGVYLLMRSHRKGCRALLLLWRPFHPLSVSFKRRFLKVDYSLIDTFATVLLLSYSKIIYISLKLTQPLTFYPIDRNGQYPMHTPEALSVDPSVKYFHGTHLGYGILAIVILMVFSITPAVILCLHPTRCGRRILTKLTLTTSRDFNRLVAAFQASFKNGSDGTTDYRIVATLYIFHRLVIFFTNSALRNHDFITFEPFVLQAALYISTFAFFSYAQPYKDIRHTIVELLLMTLLTIQSLVHFRLYGACPYKGMDVGRCKAGLERAIGIQFALLCLPQVALFGYLAFLVGKRLKRLVPSIEGVWFRSRPHPLLSSYTSMEAYS